MPRVLRCLPTGLLVLGTLSCAAAVAVVLSLAAAGAGACPEEEAAALIRLNALYQTPAEFDDWGAGNLTAAEPDCCAWPRVTCDGRGRVVLFDRPFFTESGKIDGAIDVAVLAPLTELRELDLSSNRITGFYSSTGVYGLQKVKKLHLHRNNLSDNCVIGFVSNMRSLAELRIDGNQLRTTDWIANLTALETLDMSYNHLQEIKGICHLNRLKSLKLQMNEIGSGVVGCFREMKLQELDMRNNLLTGNIGEYLQNLSEIQSLQLGYNHFKGIFHLSLMANFSSLKALVLSNNIELRIETEFPSWVPSFQLEHLALDNCIINKHSNGKIPTFLLGQRSILDLDLSGSFLSGTIPLELFYSISNSLSLRKNSLEIVEKFSLENGTSRLGMLDLSDNQIAMQLPSAFGTIFPALIYLNMSHNALYGHIPSIGPDVLEVLDLSNNHLEGVIPESLTTFPSALKYLILSNNKLQGGLLPKNSSMFMLLHLDLENNYLEGNLPPELRKSTMLKILNANNNKLSGTIPSWLFSYEGLLELSVILFKGNHLEGSIPKEWCNTINLHILDLSNNSLSGSIPDCLSDFANAYFSNLYSNNLYFPNGIKRANIPDQNIFNESYGINKESNEVTINITTKGTSMQYRGLPLEFYIGIDLSMNHLSGNIPLNLGFVPGLKSLNLSRNHLRGTIPDTFQNSLSLESLDLSHNYINGNIPSGLTQLSSLSSFNVAHNNLSGEVPYTGQFPTFDKSFFEGNPDLCGEAVEKKCCTTNITFGLWKMDIIDSPIIYWSFVFGSFATGFWATIAVLMWNSSLREKWFSAVDHLITGWN